MFKINFFLPSHSHRFESFLYQNFLLIESQEPRQPPLADYFQSIERFHPLNSVAKPVSSLAD